jgi:DNA-binding NarL/FixJ family response regulator
VPTLHRSMPRVDVLIVDDHQIFAEVLAMRLQAEPNVGSVSVAGSLGVARARARAHRAGLVLLDYHLGDECGLDLLGDLAELNPRPKILVLSGSKDPDEIVAALRGGADGWLVKAEGFDSLVDVSADVCADLMRLPRTSLREVVTRLLRGGRPAQGGETFLDRLTPRELEVLQCLVDGMPRDEIADRLFLSPHTVRTHVQNLLKRAGVHSAVALVARAREAGLADRPDLPQLT